MPGWTCDFHYWWSTETAPSRSRLCRKTSYVKPYCYRRDVGLAVLSLMDRVACGDEDLRVQRGRRGVGRGPRGSAPRLSWLLGFRRFDFRLYFPRQTCHNLTDFTVC